MNERIKEIGAFCLLLAPFFISQPVMSAGQGEGRVNMQGAIIDTACAIATESREQAVEMDIVPISEITRGGQGRSVPFSIELINCVLERADKNLPDWKQFRITFDGHVDGEMFGISGNASGIALKITDADGNIAKPGKSLPPVSILPGSYRLNYAMTLISNQRPLKTGDYFSAVRFKMDYY